MSKQPDETRPPTEEQEILQQIFRDIETKQLEFFDQAGKSLVELCGILLGIIFGIIAFGKDFPPPYFAKLHAKLLITGSLLLYLIAMGLAFLVANPRDYRRFRQNLTKQQQVLKQMITYKRNMLRAASILFWGGSAVLIVLLVVLIWEP